MLANSELVKTGIVGLDAMLYGGIPKENQVILAGGPGAGKTLMAFEYLYRNAKLGNTGIFFTLEEDPKKIIHNVKSAFPNFDDIDELIKDEKIIINGRDLSEGIFDKFENANYEFGRIVTEMESLITSKKATRAVLDSSSAFELLVKDPTIYRRSMWSLVANFRRLGVTTILTSELHSPDRSKLTFRPEHFIFDGMIVMYQSGEEIKRIRALEIIKMRGFKHSFNTAPYDITSGGFRVLSAEGISH